MDICDVNGQMSNRSGSRHCTDAVIEIEDDAEKTGGSSSGLFLFRIFSFINIHKNKNSEH